MKQLLIAGLISWAFFGLAAAAAQPANPPPRLGASLDVPVFVHVLPPAAGAQEIERAAADQREKDEKLRLDTEMTRYTGEVARDTNRMFWATVLLFLVTTGLFGVAVFQARDSRRAVKAAIHSAEVASKAVQLTAETAERQLRAYVFVIPDGPLTLVGGQFFARGKVKNCGQTPAHDVVCNFRIALRDFPWVHEPEDDLAGDPSRSSLAPGESLAQLLELSRFDDAQSAALAYSQAAIYVHGDVSYLDVFQKVRHTKFRWYCVGKDAETGNLAVHPKGNDAT